MGFFGISAPIGVGCAIALVALSACGSRYSRWERLTMGLALFNLLFLVVALLARPSPGPIAATLLTWTPLPKGTDFRRRGGEVFATSFPAALQAQRLF
jgi:hypothetical protein